MPPLIDPIAPAGAPFCALHDDLAQLAAKARSRALAPRQGIDFASNDYLALAGSARLAAAMQAAIERGVPVGSGGSRLLRGNHGEHETLEAEAAGLFGAEAALWFATGYGANSTLLATLPQRGDLIVCDELVHASVREGLRLARAPHVLARHNDPAAYDEALGRWRKAGGAGQAWIAVESLYSMDGDRAPLADLAEIAARHQAVLLIDEAHATGVFGPDGRGLAAGLAGRDNMITLHTCGKALGVEGALVCGPRVVRDFLINRGRGFIFSTAPSPVIAAVVREALRVLRDEPERRVRLMALVAHAARVLAPLGIAPTGSQIVPVVLGDDARTMAAARALAEAGFDLRGIRPPTVPVGQARLRLSLTLNATADDVDRLAVVLARVLG